MVAGFLAGWIENHDYAKALENGILAGSASTFTGELVTKSAMQNLLNTWKKI